MNGIFSTAGSDGCFNFWDINAKHRLKGSPQLEAPITATAFNMDGTMFAYAVGYDWSKGYAYNRPEGVNKIMIHQTGDDCKPKNATPISSNSRYYK